MDSLYEKLFESYGISILQELDRDYDDSEILSHLEALPLGKDARFQLEDLFFEYHHRWSTDAFALGLHLGLSLLHDHIRRARPQQVQ